MQIPNAVQGVIDILAGLVGLVNDLHERHQELVTEVPKEHRRLVAGAEDPWSVVVKSGDLYRPLNFDAALQRELKPIGEIFRRAAAAASAGSVRDMLNSHYFACVGYGDWFASDRILFGLEESPDLAVHFGPFHTGADGGRAFGLLVSTRDDRYDVEAKATPDMITELHRLVGSTGAVSPQKPPRAWFHSVPLVDGSPMIAGAMAGVNPSAWVRPDNIDWEMLNRFGGTAFIFTTQIERMFDDVAACVPDYDLRVEDLMEVVGWHENAHVAAIWRGMLDRLSAGQSLEESKAHSLGLVLAQLCPTVDDDKLKRLVIAMIAFCQYSCKVYKDVPGRIHHLRAAKRLLQFLRDDHKALDSHGRLSIADAMPAIEPLSKWHALMMAEATQSEWKSFLDHLDSLTEWPESIEII